MGQILKLGDTIEVRKPGVLIRDTTPEGEPFIRYSGGFDVITVSTPEEVKKYQSLLDEDR